MNFESLLSDKVQVRPYQREVVTECYNRFMGLHKNRVGVLSQPHKSVLVESATGSGKTIMGMLTAKALQQVDPDLVVVWEAMRKPLLAQAVKTNEAMIGLKNFYAVSMFANNIDPILAARRNGQVVLHVCDEAQHSTASSSASLHNRIKPDFVLGLSATPYRTDNQKLCFEAVVKNAGIHALIDDGYLSKFDLYTIPEYSPECVSRAYLEDRDKWGKSIFYFQNLQLCYDFNALLLAAGVRSTVVTGDSDKEAQLEAFEDGEFDCLVNCMVLTEGFDCPNLKTVWVRDSGKAPTIQMCGRVLRLHGDLPVKQVVQSKNTSYPFTKTATPENNWVLQDGVWKSLKKNEKVKVIQRNSFLAASARLVSMPGYILQRNKKRARLNSADSSFRGF
jgi:superfamily II DNA or RNA helicase